MCLLYIAFKEAPCIREKFIEASGRLSNVPHHWKQVTIWRLGNVWIMSMICQHRDLAVCYYIFEDYWIESKNEIVNHIRYNEYAIRVVNFQPWVQHEEILMRNGEEPLC